MEEWYFESGNGLDEVIKSDKLVSNLKKWFRPLHSRFEIPHGFRPRCKEQEEQELMRLHFSYELIQNNEFIEVMEKEVTLLCQPHKPSKAIQTIFGDLGYKVDQIFDFEWFEVDLLPHYNSDIIEKKYFMQNNLEKIHFKLAFLHGHLMPIFLGIGTNMPYGIEINTEDTSHNRFTRYCLDFEGNGNFHQGFDVKTSTIQAGMFESVGIPVDSDPTIEKPVWAYTPICSPLDPKEYIQQCLKGNKTNINGTRLLKNNKDIVDYISESLEDYQHMFHTHLSPEEHLKSNHLDRLKNLYGIPETDIRFEDMISQISANKPSAQSRLKAPALLYAALVQNNSFIKIVEDIINNGCDTRKVYYQNPLKELF